MPPPNATDAIANRLYAFLREDQVIRESELLARYSLDFSEQSGCMAACVVRPETSEEVADSLKVAYSLGTPVVVRGGGMSYTLAHVPSRDGTLILDMTAMNRVLEINTDDLYVMVETGVTWQQLWTALEGTGFHVRFGGTLSGERATIGGGLGSGAAGLKKGEVTDHIMGLEVVLADGRIVTTGSMATGDPMQPMRHYGPDLSGLFIHDAGALAVKTRALLRLYPAPQGIAFSCIGFNDTHAMADAMCGIGRTDLASEVMAFGEYHTRMFASEPRPDWAQTKQMINAVWKMSPGPISGLRHLMQMARPGALKSLGKWKHVLMLITEADSCSLARSRMRRLRRIARRHDGRVLPPTLAIGMRAIPFQPVARLIIGWGRENNSFPSNRVARFSDAHKLVKVVEDFWTENASIMERHGIVKTELYLIVNATFGVEPIIYWRDRMNPLRLSVISEDAREDAEAIPADEDARAVAIDLRHRLVERMGQVTGGHYQIGKFYPYQRDLVREENRELLSQIKHLLDPNGLLNPEGLGFEPPENINSRQKESQ